MWESHNFSKQQALIAHIRETKKVDINPKTLSDWVGKLRDKVMSGPPGSRMRDRQATIPELDHVIFDYVVTNNMLGGSTTDASIRKAAVQAFKAMQASGKLPQDKRFVASNGFLSAFKRRYNLSSHLRCGESASADADGVKLAREALPKVLAELKITQCFLIEAGLATP